MSDFALDRLTHDLVIVNGDFVMVEGADDTRQAIKVRLLTIKAEWFLEGPDFGWLAFADLFGKPAKEGTIRKAMLDTIHGTPGVMANSAVIERYDLDGPSRVLTVRWRCKAFDGEALSGTAEIAP